ncbi:50S ribosomal protein L9 [Candidatus Aerophobetes bacterium]|nr:50S ribosomal protein L9 [Candidatus Aerophobetes bacterium]
MKVILRENVENLGSTHNIVDVSDGYARNFLIPKGLALQATASELKKWEERKRISEQKSEREIFKARRVEEKLKDITLVIERDVGEEGKLFGSVTTQDIAERIINKFNLPIDHRKIVLDEPIRVIGIREIFIKLHPQVEIPLKVEVTKRVKEDEK